MDVDHQNLRSYNCYSTFLPSSLAISVLFQSDIEAAFFAPSLPVEKSPSGVGQSPCPVNHLFFLRGVGEHQFFEVSLENQHQVFTIVLLEFINMFFNFGRNFP
jgi:hypothetical protein